MKVILHYKNESLEIDNYKDFEYINELIEFNESEIIDIDLTDYIECKITNFHEFWEDKLITVDKYKLLNFLKYKYTTDDLYKYIAIKKELIDELSVFKYLYYSEKYDTKNNLMCDFIELMKDKYIDAYDFLTIKNLDFDYIDFDKITFTNLQNLYKIPELCKKIERFYISPSDLSYLQQLQYLIFTKLDEKNINLEHLVHCPKYIKIGKYEYDNIINIGPIEPQESYVMKFSDKDSIMFKYNHNKGTIKQTIIDDEKIRELTEVFN